MAAFSSMESQEMHYLGTYHYSIVMGVCKISISLYTRRLFEYVMRLIE